MAAANARIGVALAGYFPALSLSASYGFIGNAIDNVLKASHSVWSMGIENNGTLIDFGARGGAVDAARAAYDGTVATYRQTVLDALKEVEDQLAAQRLLAEQENAQQAATEAARKAEQVAFNQYKQGIIAYSDVLAAQNSRLSAEQSLLAVKGDRLTASTSLIEALGGGWQAPVP
jgi:outer membrane protein TolC